MTFNASFIIALNAALAVGAFATCYELIKTAHKVYQIFLQMQFAQAYTPVVLMQS